MMFEAIVSRPPWALILLPLASALAGASAIALWPDRPVPEMPAIEIGFVPIAREVPLRLAEQRIVARPFMVAPYEPALPIPAFSLRPIATRAAQRDSEWEARTLSAPATLAQIARQFKIPLSQLRRLNPQFDGFDDTVMLQEGTVVVIPLSAR